MFTNTPTFSSYSVDGIEKALAFYRDTLGLNVTQTKEGLDIKLGGGQSLFLYPKTGHVPATFTVLNFKVDDIDSAVDALKEKGIELERYDMGPTKADEKGIYRGRGAGQGPDIAWFKDPAGNILSVLEE
jgi:catechol 2,3-dioxygenase-like lactoylglutathione lyase family enzyme